jgi:hypothetical protein
MWSAGALLNNGQHKSLTSRSKRGSIKGLCAAGFPCSASRVHYEYITFPFLRLAVSVLCRAMSRRVNAPSLCTAIRVDRRCITIPLALAAYYSILCIILHTELATAFWRTRTCCPGWWSYIIQKLCNCWLMYWRTSALCCGCGDAFILRKKLNYVKSC